MSCYPTTYSFPEGCGRRVSAAWGGVGRSSPADPGENVADKGVSFAVNVDPISCFVSYRQGSRPPLLWQTSWMAHVSNAVAPVGALAESSEARSIVDVTTPEQFDGLLKEAKDDGLLVCVDFQASW